MAAIHQIAVLVATAAVLFDDSKEGCLVALNDPLTDKAVATPGADNTKLCGVLLNVADEGHGVDVAIPGYSGIVECRASAEYSGIKPGVLLTANSAGTFKPAAAGDTVYALCVTAPTESGALFDATLCPPFVMAGADEE